MFNYGMTQAQVTSQIQQTLLSLRNALEAAANLYTWTSSLALSDLETLGYSPDDAQDILNAVADANSLAGIYKGGTFGGSLPYNFSATQSTIVGPQ